MTDSIKPTEPASQKPTSEQELIRVILYGEEQAVNVTISKLELLTFAAVSDWSPLSTGPNLSQVMSTLNRYIPR